MTKGTLVYSFKDGKNHRVTGTRMARIGERDVLKVICDKREFFYDEVMQLRRKNDTWWGRLFFGRS